MLEDFDPVFPRPFNDVFFEDATLEEALFEAGALEGLVLARLEPGFLVVDVPLRRSVAPSLPADSSPETLAFAA